MINLFCKMNKIRLVFCFVCCLFLSTAVNQTVSARQININNCKNNPEIVNNSLVEFYLISGNEVGLENMLAISNVAKQNVINPRTFGSKNAVSSTASQQNLNQCPTAKPSLGTLQAYNNIKFRGDKMSTVGEKMHVDVKFITPDGKPADFAQTSESYKKAQNKLSTAVENKNPNYSWVTLPEKLIKDNYVENVYSTVKEFKKPFGEDSKLIFVALGNPANADEMAKSLGLGHNMVQSCDITPAQMKNTIKKAGGNLDKIQIIISSKSGSTFESNQTYKLLTDELTEHYKAKGVKSEDMQEQISKHFLFLTDKNPEKSKLKKEAQALGIKTIDCVEGHSGFADMAYSMPTLAYVGLPEESAVKMLKSADDMSKKLMMSADLNNNIAAQMAAYDCNSATKQRYIFHDVIADFSNTEKQLNQEHLRELNYATDVYPRDAHSGLEPAISSKLQGQQVNNITNVVTRVNYKPSEKEALYLKESQKLEEAHIRNAQAEGHFQKQLILEMGHEGVTPESLGEYEMLKSFNTYYTNEFKHDGALNIFNIDYVNGYKKIRENL